MQILQNYYLPNWAKHWKSEFDPFHPGLNNKNNFSIKQQQTRCDGKCEESILCLSGLVHTYA